MSKRFVSRVSRAQPSTSCSPWAPSCGPWVPSCGPWVPDLRSLALARPGHEISDLRTISCPGRVQRALLRERNETRDPGATRRLDIPSTVYDCGRMSIHENHMSGDKK